MLFRQLVESMPRPELKFTLLIQINSEGTIPCLCKANCQVQRCYGLARAALYMSERECICHFVSSIPRNKLVTGAADGLLIQKQRV